MDTFARQQRRTSLIPWSSINWDGWEFQSLPISPNTQVTEQAITAGEGGTAFAQALALSLQEPQLVVSTRDLKARLNKWINQTVKPTSVLQQDQSEPEKMGSFHPRPDLPLAYVPPVTELEQQIAQVWQDVLHIAKVGLQDNFFDLGGHSLLLVQVHQQLCNRLQQDIALIDLFNYPTVSALAQHLQNAFQVTSLSPSLPPIKAAPPSLVTQAEQSREAGTNQSFQSPPAIYTTYREHDIAIIGIAGRFPGANTLEEFWANLQAGVESLTFFSDEELAEEGVPEQVQQNPYYVKATGMPQPRITTQTASTVQRSPRVVASSASASAMRFSLLAHSRRIQPSSGPKQLVTSRSRR